MNWVIGSVCYVLVAFLVEVWVIRGELADRNSVSPRDASAFMAICLFFWPVVMIVGLVAYLARCALRLAGGKP